MTLAAVVAATLAMLPSPAAALPPAHPFGPAVLYPAGDGVRALAAADFDGDGDPDVLVVDATGHLTLHVGDGEGRLGGPSELEGPALDDARDLTGDGLPDLVGVVGGEAARVDVRVADGRGGFGPVQSSPADVATGPVLGVAAGAFAGDDAPDLAILADAPSAPRLWIAAGRADGTVAPWREVAAPPDATSVHGLGDLNGDGREDLGTLGRDGLLRVHLSTADDGFAEAATRRVAPAGEELGAAVVGRFGLDAPPAIAVADVTRGCLTLVALPPEADEAEPCTTPSGRVEGLTAGDVDGDGGSDLVHGTTQGRVEILRAAADGALRSTPVQVDRASFTSSPLLADLDGDGRLDLVVVADLRSLAVLPNVGRPALAAAPSRVTFGWHAVGRRSPALVVRVVNDGSYAATVTAVVEGPDGADFLIARDGCQGRRLAPGARCSLRVRFAPLDEGRRRARLVVSADGADEPVRVVLRGRGVACRP